MDQRNLAIGVLSITASILFVGLLILTTQPERALAAGMTISRDDYVLTVGQLTTNEEMLYLIDSPQETLVTYSFDGNQRTIELVESINLKDMREATKPQQQAPQPPARGGTRPRSGRP